MPETFLIDESVDRRIIRKLKPLALNMIVCAKWLVVKNRFLVFSRIQSILKKRFSPQVHSSSFPNASFRDRSENESAANKAFSWLNKGYSYLNVRFSCLSREYSKSKRIICALNETISRLPGTGYPKRSACFSIKLRIGVFTCLSKIYPKE